MERTNTSNTISIKIEEKKVPATKEESKASSVQKPALKSETQKKIEKMQEMQKKAILKLQNQMSELKVDDKKEADIDTECPICLGCMAEPTQLSCKHRFCISCLGKNFIQTSKCPLCRK